MWYKKLVILLDYSCFTAVEEQKLGIEQEADILSETQQVCCGSLKLLAPDRHLNVSYSDAVIIHVRVGHILLLAPR